MELYTKSKLTASENLGKIETIRPLYTKGNHSVFEVSNARHFIYDTDYGAGFNCR